jgi:general stress protein 26
MASLSGGTPVVARHEDSDPTSGGAAVGDDQQEQHERKVRELVQKTRLAMLTSVDPDGRLVSMPMATQEVEFAGEIWFIAERESHKVRNITRNPQVNVAYSGNGSWVSVSGEAEVVDDAAKLAELWNTFTGAWLEGGPDNPNNILIHVSGTSAEYWDTPGSKVVQVANLVKAKVTGDTYDADNASVNLDR